MVVVFLYTLPSFEKVWQRNTFEGLEGDFAVPSWPFKLLILIGSIMCAIQFGRSILLNTRKLLSILNDNFVEYVRVGRLLIIIVASTAVLYTLAKYVELRAVDIGIIYIFCSIYIFYYY